MWRWNINLLTGWMSHIFPQLYQYEKDILSYTCPTPLSVSWLILNVSGEEWGVISWSLLPPSHSPNQLATHLLLPTPTVLDPSVSRLRRLSSISHPPRALLSQVLWGLMEVILGCSDHKSRCSWQTLEEFLECPGWDVFFYATEWSFSSHPCSLILERAVIGYLYLILKLSCLCPKHNLQGRPINSQGS